MAVAAAAVVVLHGGAGGAGGGGGAPDWAGTTQHRAVSVTNDCGVDGLRSE